MNKECKNCSELKRIKEILNKAQSIKLPIELNIELIELMGWEMPAPPDWDEKMFKEKKK